MGDAGTFKARRELAQQMGQKAEALRVEAERELFRCEGAVGALEQAIEVIGHQQRTVKEELDRGDLELVEAEQLNKGMTRAILRCQALLAGARSGLSQARGRLAQAESTLDMMEAIFTADVAAANIAVIREEARLGPIDESRHPGPSIADQRRDEEADSGGDS